MSGATCQKSKLCWLPDEISFQSQSLLYLFTVIDSFPVKGMHLLVLLTVFHLDKAFEQLLVFTQHLESFCYLFLVSSVEKRVYVAQYRKKRLHQHQNSGVIWTIFLDMSANFSAVFNWVLKLMKWVFCFVFAVVSGHAHMTYKMNVMWALQILEEPYQEIVFMPFTCAGSQQKSVSSMGPKMWKQESIFSFSLYIHDLNKWEVEGCWESVVEKCHNKRQTWWFCWVRLCVCLWWVVGGPCLLWLNELNNNKSAKTVMRSRETLNSRPDEETRNEHTHSHIDTNRPLLHKLLIFMHFCICSHMLSYLNNGLIQANKHADEP